MAKLPTPAPVGRFSDSDVITITRKQLEGIFTEWDRRFRADPDKFMSQAEHLLKETAETYGEDCAPYFISIYQELESQA